MVFIGGWRSRRRRRYGPYDDGEPFGVDPYGNAGPRGYGRYGRRYRRGYGPAGGGNSCLRDMFLIEGGCCLAELIGCGPQLALVAPRVARAHLVSPRKKRAAAAPAHPATGRLQRSILALALELIACYQREVSAKRRPCCRYAPTCSHYAAQALEVHGLWRGSWLTAKRLLRCRPGAAGGADPVPGATAVPRA